MWPKQEQTDWQTQDSPATVSILLSMTNSILTSAASETNIVIAENTHFKPKLLKVPTDVRKACKILNIAHNNFKRAVGNQKKSAEINLSEAKKF